MSTMDFLAEACATLAGKPFDALFDPRAGSIPVVLRIDATGALVVDTWDASLGPQPTVAQIMAEAQALAQAASGATPPTPARLVAYAQAKQAAIASGGVSVNVAPAGAPALMIEADTSTAGKIDLSGLLQLSSLHPTGVFAWVQGSSAIPLSQSQVQALALGVGSFVQLTFTQLGAVLAAIAAGTITTTAQIDDPTTVGLPAWPANS